jgi:hypothetical protein
MQLERAQVHAFERIVRDPRVQSIKLFGSQHPAYVEYRVNFTDGTFGSHVHMDQQGAVVVDDGKQQ